MERAVYVQTNDAERNEVAAFGRGEDGPLTPLGRHATGGRGNRRAHLRSQGSVTPGGHGRFLLVTNGGSGEVSVFRVGDGGLGLAGTTPTGDGPASVAEHDELVHVIDNGGDGEIAGFRLARDGSLAPIAGSRRPLSRAGADGAQIGVTPDGRSLVVTERATAGISVYAVGDDGRADGPQPHRSAGATPYGFDFTPAGVLVVTEAFGAQMGRAAASAYGRPLEPISASVGSGRSEVCWAAVTRDGRFACVTNFGDDTISSYRVADDGSIELVDATAATTVDGEQGVRDEALTRGRRFLFALDADARRVFGFEIGGDGTLTPVGSADRLPAAAAGLAAS